jgi:DHA2 family multidrug resistance protein
MYSWRWSFYINLPLGILTILGVAMYLKDSEHDKGIKLDAIGFGLLSAAIGGFQLMLDRGTTLDWFSSREIIIEAMVAALAFYAFVTHMFTSNRPFLNPATFKDGNFVIGMVTAFVVMMVMNGNVALMPSMLQSLMGYPVLETGFLVLPRGIGALISVAMINRLPRNVDLRIFILIGLGLTAVSLFQMSGFNLTVTAREIQTTGLLQGFGTGMVFAPLVQIAFSSLNPRSRTEGASVFSLIRNLGVAIGVSTDATLVARNTQINHAELVGHITPYSKALQFLPPNLTTESAAGAVMLEGEISRQAGMIAYNDMFRLSAFLIIGVALIVPFMRLRPITQSMDEVSVEL